MNANDPAFPCAEESFPYPGLTKRELFAALAMQGVLGNATLTAVMSRGAEECGRSAEAFAAQLGYEFADALIARLSKEQP